MLINGRTEKGWLARRYKLLRSFIQTNNKGKENWGKELMVKIDTCQWDNSCKFAFSLSCNVHLKESRYKISFHCGITHLSE